MIIYMTFHWYSSLLKESCSDGPVLVQIRVKQNKVPVDQNMPSLELYMVSRPVTVSISKDQQSTQ